MPWSTFKTKPISNKIVLVEVDLAQLQEGFINGGNGNWKYTYNTFRTGTFNLGNGSLGYGNLGGTATEGGDPLAPDVLGSVFVSGEEYTEVSTYATMRTTNKSWFYDLSIYTLYVHFDNETPASFYTVNVGFVFGLSNKAININNRYYEPRLVSVPSLQKTKDLLFFGVIKFDGGQLEFINDDGFFDQWADLAIFGQPVTIKYGGDDLAYNEYYTLFQGYIENALITWPEFTMQIVDNKKKLSRILPINRFDLTTYPNLRDRNVGKPIPLPFGECKNVPVICTNEEQGGPPANYNFKVADTSDYPGGIQNITAVYVDDISRPFTITDLLQGTFDVSSGNYTRGQKVSADIVGLATVNLIARADCESTTNPAMLNETTANPNNCTFARSAAQAFQGTYSYLMTKTVAPGTISWVAFADNTSTSDLHGVSPGDTITLSAWVYVPTTGGPSSLSEVFLRIAYYDAVWITTDSSAPAAYDTWQRLTVTATLSGGATAFSPQLIIDSAAASGEFCYIDNIQVEKDSSATTWVLREALNLPLNLIPSLIDVFEDIPFIADFYDLSEWATAQANALHNETGINVAKEIEIIEIIEKLSRSIFGNFIVKDSGLFTFRIFDPTASPIAAVTLKDELEGPSIDYQAVDFLSAVIVEYRKDYKERDFARYEDNSRETAIVSEFKKFSSKEFETQLVNDADAVELATAIYDYMDDVLPVVTLTTTIEFIDAEIGDIFTFEVNRISGDLLGNIDVEILGVTKDIIGSQTILVGRQKPT